MNVLVIVIDSIFNEVHDQDRLHCTHGMHMHTMLIVTPDGFVERQSTLLLTCTHTDFVAQTQPTCHMYMRHMVTALRTSALW